MAISGATFNNALSQKTADVQSVIQGLETWAGNKIDSTPNFDFAGPLNTLNVALAAFEAAVGGITAL